MIINQFYMQTYSKIFQKRLHNITATQKLLLILTAFLATAWMYLAFFFLNFEASYFLSKLQIDKIIHFSGGVSAAGILFIFSGIKNKKLILSVLAVGLIWEIWELTCIQSQFDLFQNDFYIWLFDTLGDIAFDILGAYFWVKISKK